MSKSRATRAAEARRNLKGRKKVNDQGLGRYIDADKRRAVRKACYYGCVICGKFPYHYDHVEVEYNMAEDHRVEDLALLCFEHHGEKSARRLAVGRVKASRLSPYNKGSNPRYLPTFGPKPMRMMIGTNICTGRKAAIVVNGVTVFGVDNSGPGGDEHHLLTGVFVDPTGRYSVQFEENEIRVMRGVWDFELIGQVLTVRAGRSQIIAQVRFAPDEGVVEVQRLEMRLAGGYHISVRDGALELIYGEDAERRAAAKGPLRKPTPNTAVQRFYGCIFHPNGGLLVSPQPPGPDNMRTPSAILQVTDPAAGTLKDWLRSGS